MSNTAPVLKNGTPSNRTLDKRNNGRSRQGTKDFERMAEIFKANQKLSVEIAKCRHATNDVETERLRLNAVLDMLPVYVILLTPDYHVSFANRFFRERFGESGGRQRRDMPHRELLLLGQGPDLRLRHRGALRPQ